MSGKDKQYIISLICGILKKTTQTHRNRTDWWLPEIAGWRVREMRKGGQKVQIPVIK